LRFVNLTVEDALLFNHDSVIELASRALHLYAVFGARFSLCPSSAVSRIYVEKCRKAIALHPRLGRTVNFV
jgi:hypothetical protein